MYDYIPEVFISDNGGIYFEVVTDPTNEDTDGDGIVDGNEVVMLRLMQDMIILIHLMSIPLRVYSGRLTKSLRKAIASKSLHMKIQF